MYSIFDLALWNGAAGSTANVRDIRVATSNTPDFSTLCAVGSFTNPQLDAENPYPATIFDLTDSTGRYLRLEILSYYGNPNVVEIGEIAVNVLFVCDPDSGDVTGDDCVTFADILQLLSAWGPCGDCPEDVDNSGEVDFQDVLAVLAAWGPCP